MEEMSWLRTAAAVAVPILALVIWMARWFGKHNEWMKGIDDFKKQTTNALEEIRNDIKRLLESQPRSVLAATSPLRLTDLGREVSECVRAAAWAAEKAVQLADKVKGKSAYEIQEFCINYMRAEYQPPDVQDQLFKKCAYDHGIKLKQVLDVCAVELRDRLLSVAAEVDAENAG